MQTVEIRLWDDLHAKQGDKVPSDVQVMLEYKGKRRRLDLTSAHAEELDKLLAPYMAAGQNPDAPPAHSTARPEKPGTKAGGKLLRVAPEGMSPHDWRRGMREWSDSLGLVNRKDPDLPAWQSSPGKWYYPGDLEDAFLLHLQGDEEAALKLVAQFKPQAA